MITEDTAEPLEAIVVETRPSNPITTVIAWISVGLVVFVMVGWVWTRWIDPSTGGIIDRYANHKGGVEFENPHDQFRVTMPTTWHRTTSTNALGQIVTVTSDPSPEYSFSVTKTPEPTAALESFKSSLNQVAGQLVSQAGAEIVSQTDPVPLVDIGVKGIVYRKGNTYWRASLQLVKDRLYTLIAKTPNSDIAPFKRLATSFTILGPR